jgi:flagellar protein FliS
MTQNSRASQEYLKNAVMTATPEQLQLMLYDGAIRFATRGLEAMQAKDREGMFNALERAQLIVLELSNGIRREVNPTLADQMAALYSFVYRRLVDANIHCDEQALQEALRILRYQRETWLLLMKKLQEQPPRGASRPPAQIESSPESEAAPFNVEG